MNPVPGKMVRNERIKLRATALNSVAVASVVAGFVTPIAALSFGIGSSTPRGLLGTVVAAFVWLATGFLIPYLAGRTLGGLQE